MKEFEGEDLSDAVFWGVGLQRAYFRDADFTGARFFHTQWTDVEIDGLVERLVINGVDVTDHVNANDPWYPLRAQLEPTDEQGIQESWRALQTKWRSLLDRASRLETALLLESVNGEWSLRDTLRHRLFARDKWFFLPLLGNHVFTPIGLPNTGSSDFPWPGLDRTSDPDFSLVVAAVEEQDARISDYVGSLKLEALPVTVEVMENGTVPSIACFHVVLEEDFEHLRYALRDLEILLADR